MFRMGTHFDRVTAGVAGFCAGLAAAGAATQGFTRRGLLSALAIGAARMIGVRQPEPPLVDRKQRGTETWTGRPAFAAGEVVQPCITSGNRGTVRVTIPCEVQGDHVADLPQGFPPVCRGDRVVVTWVDGTPTIIAARIRGARWDS